MKKFSSVVLRIYFFKVLQFGNLKNVVLKMTTRATQISTIVEEIGNDPNLKEDLKIVNFEISRKLKKKNFIPISSIIKFEIGKKIFW